eukprot:Selendium_serpulae@DN6336_c0_g1_i7.p1
MSSFGTLFKVSTFGESHGGAVGVVVDGVPPDLEINEQDVQIQLTRRRPGQSSLTTQRQEEDRVEILSGTEKGKTLGTPIGMIVRNKDQRTIDYANTAAAPRPGHADYTYRIKYGIAASSGGGRASARETIGRVAAGAIGEKWLNAKFGTKIISWVSSVTHLSVPQDITAQLEHEPPSREEVDRRGTVMKNEIDGIIKFCDCEGVVYDAEGAPIPGQKGDPTAGEPLPTRCPHPPTAVKIAIYIQKVVIDLRNVGALF